MTEPQERPLSADEHDTVRKTIAPATAAAGAVAGATAGLATMVAGPIGAVVGAVMGAMAGGAIGAAGSQSAGEGTYTSEHDAYYRSLWEGASTGTPAVADRSFDNARPAYLLGHLAAQHKEYAGRDFARAEPDLRRAWDADFAARHGAWETVRPQVRDAYGHSRAEGYGVRRDTDARVGSGGSAVDPVELERARAGLPSRDDEQDTTLPYPTELAGTTRTAEHPMHHASDSSSASSAIDANDEEAEQTPDQAAHHRLTN